MRLCLICRFVSPSGAQLCGGCGRSFGGRLCPRHHLSPIGSQFCVQCGREDLTEGTLSLPLGWLNRLLAWGAVLLVVVGVSHHADSLARGLGISARWGAVHLLNIRPTTLVRWAVTGATWLTVLLLLSLLLPRAAGGRVRAALLGSIPWAGRMLLSAAWHTARWLSSRVEGEPKRDAHKAKKKSRP